jgi:hypothetical protein
VGVKRCQPRAFGESGDGVGGLSLLGPGFGSSRLSVVFGGCSRSQCVLLHRAWPWPWRGWGWRWYISFFNMAKNDSATVLSQHTPVRPVDWRNTLRMSLLKCIEWSGMTRSMGRWGVCLR